MAKKDGKTRIDAFEAKLTDEQRWEAYMRSKSASWTDVVAWMAETFGIRKPGKSAYFRFIGRMLAEDSSLRLARAAAAVKEVKRYAESAGLKGDDDLVETLKSLAAEAQMNSGDTETSERLIRMAVSLRKTALDAQKLALDRERFEAAERRLAAAEGTVGDERLTDEEKMARLRRIFGLKV